MKPLEDCLKTFQMVLKSVRKYDDVVEIYKTISQIYIAHGSFHEPLKRCRCIAEAKRHTIAFVES